MFASPRGTASYLLFYAANAALLPMLALYYQSAGVSGVQLGLLTSLWPAGSMVGAWMWGAVADGSGRHRRVLAITIVGAALSVQLFWGVSSFVVFVPVVSVFSIVSSPVAPMLDQGVLLDLDGSEDRFGRVRLWGAVGWGVTAPLAGLVMDRVGLRAAFPIYGLLMLGLLFVSRRLPVEGERLGAAVLTGLREIFRSRAWRRFLGIVLIAATGSTMVHHYLFVYLDSIGASGALRGLALSVATTSELAVFAFADRLLKRFRPSLLILVAMAAASLQLLLFGAIGNPLLALLPPLLHGLSFSLRLVAGVAIARRLAPRGMGATSQSIFTAAQMGAAGIAGALIGGALFRFFSPRAAFAWVGLAVLLGLILAVLSEVRVAARAGDSS